MTDDLGRGRADDDPRADRGLAVDVERRPRHRDVDQGGGIFAPVREFEQRIAVARRDALVAPVFGQAQRLAVGEPGQLRDQLVALAGGTLISIANPVGKIRVTRPSTRPI